MDSKVKPLVALSLMIEEDYLKAAGPLFEMGLIEALEWSFDISWGTKDIPKKASPKRSKKEATSIYPSILDS